MSQTPEGRPTVRIDGADPLLLPWDVAAERLSFEVVRGPVAFECASGDRIEREYTGVAVFDLLEAAAMPGDTTHVQFESVNGDLACIPLADLNGAVLALGDGPGTAPGRPRFVSPRVLGPRTVKNVCRLQPRTLAASADREAYERLPLDD
ncbi:unknown [Haloarcula marismortui ATCC 43049]|uniref:Oxidoreductase molybdopterin-binding domain-containing protein n=1 Tax=Haloarcula marismortui (strain ATCC 43049 / DSM 3752 / JCM 8966 / VKM B-1809) TaxID=272569 RepID=Q5UZG1_HALMA|nr:hypothetical protein [Haloarcula marismortui]AAV47342.1 unknown [Haloarcula marismortui ATCC 43049]QCP92047.1 hypothetical protein E6P14_14720 [Haloarcula marismortui ATCC 43049]